MAKYNNRLELTSNAFKKLLSGIDSYIKSFNDYKTSFDKIPSTIPIRFPSSTPESIFDLNALLKQLLGKKGTYTFDIALVKNYLKKSVTAYEKDLHYLDYKTYFADDYNINFADCKYYFVLPYDSIGSLSRSELIDFVKQTRELLFKYSSPCAKFMFMFEYDLGVDTFDGHYLDEFSVSSITFQISDKLKVRLVEPYKPDALYHKAQLRTYNYVDSSSISDTGDFIMYTPGGASVFLNSF